MNRKNREKAVAAKMITIYCRRHHRPDIRYSGCNRDSLAQDAATSSESRNGYVQLCQECTELLGYVCRRIDACPLGPQKSSCRKCAIHCYQPRYRRQIREVMRYAGPRMLYLAPLTALRHLLSELRFSF